MMMKAVMMMVMLMVGVSVQAQDISDVLNSVLGGSGDDAVSNLTSIFSSKKQATKENVIGTWSYTEPAIVFTSDNILAKAGSKIAANKLEKKIQEYLTRYGIKPGAFTMTFNEDGTLIPVTVLSAGPCVKSLAVTTQVSGKEMMFVTDATKLLNLFKTFGAKSSSSQIRTITSLMKSINGMQAGVTMRKQ